MRGSFQVAGDGAGLTLSSGVFEPAVSARDVERFFELINEELPGPGDGPRPVISSVPVGR